MKVPIFESASELFAVNQTFNLDVLNRNSKFSLMNRMLDSNNTLVKALCNSEARIHSKIWKRWAVDLGVEWDFIMMM